MATIEVEKLIHQLQPKYLQELRHYLEYLLFVQDKEAKPSNGAKEKPANKSVEPTGEGVPERLRLLQQFKGDAPFPRFPTSKYDVYEQ